jgi:uncharacterized membrane protein
LADAAVEEIRAGARRRRSVTVVVMLVAAGTMFLGAAHKSLCFGEGFYEHSVTDICYTDLLPLYRAEQLDSGKIPYLQADNEYPVLTGLFMWVASLPVNDREAFFIANAVPLFLLGLLTAYLLARVVGRRALFFAAAPTLALYAFLNWDLIAVALMTAGLVAYLRRRDVAAGVLLGLGTAAKVFPGFMLPPLALDRARGRAWRGVALLLVSSAVAWLAVNLPVAIASPRGWAYGFRFNAERPVQWATLWFVGCRVLPVFCRSVPLVDVLSLAMFLTGVGVVWYVKSRWEPGYPAWTLGFPILIVFLLTNKVYSPQYSIWLLPWFALVLPDVRVFLAFEAADVFEVITEFRWIGAATGQGAGAPRWLLLIAILCRAAVLLWMLWSYLRTEIALVAPRGVIEPLPDQRALAPEATSS